MAKKELHLLYNGRSEDGEVVFASVKGKPESPSIRMDADQFDATYDEIEKGDGFTVRTGLTDVSGIGPVFIPMIAGKPMRGQKRHIVRFDTKEQATSAIGDIDNATVLSTFNYVDLGTDLELVEGVRPDEAHGERVELTKADAGQHLGL